MLILSNTTDTIQVLLSASSTNPVQCIAFYHDLNSTSDTPARNRVNTNGTTPVVLVPAPSAGNQRVVDSIVITNTNTSAVNLTIRYNDNSNLTRLFFANLGIDEKIEYTKHNGFQVFTNNGALKQTYSAGNSLVNSGDNIVVLPADVVNNNATANTLEDITGLSFGVNAGSNYYFKAVLKYTVGATSTGSRYVFDIVGGTATQIYAYSQVTLSTTAFTFSAGLSVVDTPTIANASSAGTTGNVAIMEGFFNCTVSGTWQAKHASEIASGNLTTRAGSLVKYRVLN
jgi:hypothetical protein